MTDARIVDYVDMALLLSRETTLTRQEAQALAKFAWQQGLQPYVAYDIAAMALAGRVSPYEALSAVVDALKAPLSVPVMGHNRFVESLTDMAAWWARAYRAAACLVLERFAAPVSRETVGRHRK
jgi:hypothetical protein